MPSRARGAMVNLAKYSVCERVQRYESPGRGRTLPNLDVSVPLHLYLSPHLEFAVLE